jgi:hypothetical protein
VNGVQPPRCRATSTPVHPHSRVLIDRLEMQQQPSTKPPGRDPCRASIPDRFHEVPLADTRQLRLRAERHHDLARQPPFEKPALKSVIRSIDLELPDAVQTQPLLADELRPRILRLRNLCHDGRELWGLTGGCLQDLKGNGTLSRASKPAAAGHATSAGASCARIAARVPSMSKQAYWLSCISRRARVMASCSVRSPAATSASRARCNPRRAWIE